MNSKQSLQKINDHPYVDRVIYSILSVIVVFLMVNKYMRIIIIFLCIIVIIEYFNKKGNFVVSKAVLPFYFYLLLILVQIFLKNTWHTEINMIVKEIIRNLIYIIIITITSNLKLDWSYYYKNWGILFLLVSTVLLMQFLHIPIINIILSNFYYESVQLLTSEYNSISQFRAGSIFLNPNVLSIYTLMMMSIFLIKKKEINIWMTLILISVLILTGSRTGFIVGITLLIINFLSIKKIRINLKSIIFLILLVFTIVIFPQTSFGSVLRIFDIRSGFTTSIFIKQQRFFEVIKKSLNISTLFFGLGPFDYRELDNLMIDFDYGYIISYYGLIGMLIYTFFILLLIKINKQSMGIIFLIHNSLIIIMLMFSLTAGFYFDLRIFSIFLVLFFPTIKPVFPKRM